MSVKLHGGCCMPLLDLERARSITICTAKITFTKPCITVLQIKIIYIMHQN